MGIQIRIDYQDVMKKAGVIQNQSEALYHQISRLENLEKELSGDWNGPASRTFCAKLSQLIDRMKGTREKMSYASKQIEVTAGAIHRADMEAQNQAGQL